ncbi:MAG: metabolite traffic protein EboE [bacterium]
MKLSSGLTLAYCTNIHRGEGWNETFAGLKSHALRVRDRVAKGGPFVLGLRLSNQALIELREPDALKAFQAWLEKENCLVAGINGFPFGSFHGVAVKEKVFSPDWCEPARLEYTKGLFDLLAQIGTVERAGTVSTLPGSFKSFNRDADAQKVMRNNILGCAEHLAKLRDRTGLTMRLAVEPEPMGLVENTTETIQLFNQLRDEASNATVVDEFLGVCYDTCHFALQYEGPAEAMTRLNQNGAPVVKLHLSSALCLKPTARALQRLATMQEPVYLHQCMGKRNDGTLERYKDIPDALTSPSIHSLEEMRVHFHVPLNAENLGDDLSTTAEHLIGALDVVARTPGLVRELEIETYTWEVLPEAMRSADVVEQIIGEYDWTLSALSQRGAVSL